MYEIWLGGAKPIQMMTDCGIQDEGAQEIPKTTCKPQHDDAGFITGDIVDPQEMQNITGLLVECKISVVHPGSLGQTSGLHEHSH